MAKKLFTDKIIFRKNLTPSPFDMDLCCRYVTSKSFRHVVALIKPIHVMSLKVTSGKFFFHFREVFEKCIDYIGKFLAHISGRFLNCLEKGGYFGQILDHFIAHFLESP